MMTGWSGVFIKEMNGAPARREMEMTRRIIEMVRGMKTVRCVLVRHMRWRSR